MKTKTIITAIIAAASINTLAAQELLTDGKVWNCVQRMYNDQTGEYDRPFTITVVGDTIVGGTKCKRLEQVWHDDTGTLFHFAALERDSRVYHVTDDCEDEFLNFNLSVGDIDGLSGRVVAVDKVTVNGITRKRITIDRDGHLQYLVDGIELTVAWLAPSGEEVDDERLSVVGDGVGAHGFSLHRLESDGGQLGIAVTNKPEKGDDEYKQVFSHISFIAYIDVQK